MPRTKKNNHSKEKKRSFLKKKSPKPNFLNYLIFLQNIFQLTSYNYNDAHILFNKEYKKLNNILSTNGKRKKNKTNDNRNRRRFNSFFLYCTANYTRLVYFFVLFCLVLVLGEVRVRTKPFLQLKRVWKYVRMSGGECVCVFVCKAIELKRIFSFFWLFCRSLSVTSTQTIHSPSDWSVWKLPFRKQFIAYKKRDSTMF